MIKSIKVMLLPNNFQKTRLHQHAGAARFLYNWALAKEEENYEAGGKFILISENLPYDAAVYQDADAIVLAYLGVGLDVDPTKERAV